MLFREDTCEDLISGQEIHLCQRAELYKPHSEPEGKRVMNRKRCRVVLESGHNADFHLGEDTQEGNQPVHIDFTHSGER